MISPATPEWSSLRDRLVRRPVVALVAGLMALSLAACGDGDAASTVGTLDKIFGAGSSDGTPDGMASVSLGAGNDTTRGTAIQADGKILVVGSSTSSGAGTTSSNIVVERFKTDGTLDASFGAGNGDGSPDGVVTLSLGSGSEEGRAIAVQADGKIIVAGTSTSPEVTGSGKNIVVARLNSDGTPDATFGADNNGDNTPDGFVAVSLGNGDDVADAIAIQADGKILVAGTAAGGADSNIAVVRLNANGSLDAAGFGVGQQDGSPDGVVTLSLGAGSDAAVGIAVQSDDRIVVVGNSTSVGGNGSSNIVVARLNPDGTLDGFFGKANDGTPDGVVNVSLGAGDDVASAVAIQANGKILVAGSTVSASGKNAAVARLNADGSVDASFGAGSSDGTPDGSVALSLGNGDDELGAIAVDADGRIVVVGTTTSTGNSSNVFVARLNADGKLDTSFGQGNDGTPDGVVNLSFGDGNDYGRTVALQADGKIVVAGDRVNGGSSDIVLARLLVN
jgi:uncharacterized delta-60 repeat protein